MYTIPAEKIFESMKDLIQEGFSKEYTLEYEHPSGKISITKPLSYWISIYKFLCERYSDQEYLNFFQMIYLLVELDYTKLVSDKMDADWTKYKDVGKKGLPYKINTSLHFKEHELELADFLAEYQKITEEERKNPKINFYKAS